MFDADLSGADLRDAAIRADLRGANLTNAGLRGADLSRALLGHTHPENAQTPEELEREAAIFAGPAGAPRGRHGTKRPHLRPFPESPLTDSNRRPLPYHGSALQAGHRQRP